MLDRYLLRNNPEKVRQGTIDKGESCYIDEWLLIDSERRILLQKSENLRARKNVLSTEVSEIRKAGGNADEQIAESKIVGENIALLEKEKIAQENKLKELELTFPNIPDSDVPVGADESDNIIQRTNGETPIFDFEAKPHWELMENQLDSKASGEIAGSNFILFRGWAARLQRKLISWMMDFNADAGLEEVWVPFLASTGSMVTTGQIPKLKDDMYKIDGDDLYLIPTGEVPITNIYRGTMLTEKKLPIRMFGYTPCFRREAGSYGKETRGLNRVHQFEKVEMVTLAHPENSDEMLETMVSHVDEMLKHLGLPYRVSLLATGDLSFAAAKCYDVEVWAAGQGKWLEVSSISNFKDFQARRGNIRFRPDGGGKPLFVHTLNGSALALPRIIAALVENNQNADGTIDLNKVPGHLIAE